MIKVDDSRNLKHKVIDTYHVPLGGGGSLSDSRRQGIYRIGRGNDIIVQ